MPDFQTAAGVNIYYEVHGEGIPLIFIHPPLAGHVIFKYQFDLSRKYKVIFYDCRGHGKSGYLPSAHPEDVISDHVQDLKALIDHLKIEHPVITGYSNGGLIALAYALAFPDAIGALVLSGGYPKVDTWLLKQEYNSGIFLMKKKKLRFLSYLIAKTHKVTRSDQQQFYSYGLKANRKAVLDLYVAGKIYNAASQLHKLRNLPILVLYGTKDIHVYQHKKYFETLPNAKIIFIKKAFHQLPTHWYPMFNWELIQFIEEKASLS
ncbi:alpha/beta hydrolase [Bacillaceae bacterium Marseille-Q3522]|nr:alpha/beta hydrolase [Bacillaceae bacterium Marseille-Q3522]